MVGRPSSLPTNIYLNSSCYRSAFAWETDGVADRVGEWLRSAVSLEERVDRVREGGQGSSMDRVSQKKS